MTGRLPCASNHTKDAPSVVTKASKFSKSSRILQIPNILLDANSKIFSSNASPLHIRHLVTSLSILFLHPRTLQFTFFFYNLCIRCPKNISGEVVRVKLTDVLQKNCFSETPFSKMCHQPPPKFSPQLLGRNEGHFLRNPLSIKLTPRTKIII